MTVVRFQRHVLAVNDLAGSHHPAGGSGQAVGLREFAVATPEGHRMMFAEEIED